MLACIPKNKIRQCNLMQKNIKIEEVLSELEYFESEEEAIKNDCVPLSFVTSIRTAYSNLVVNHEGKYYVSLTLASVVPHIGYDLLAFMSSSAVAKVIDCTKKENQELMFQSQLVPVGVYNPDVGICNPIIYSQVVIKDDLSDSLNNSLLEGNSLESISDMKREGNMSAILNEIILVSEVKL